MWKYIKENEENFDKLHKKFIKNKKIFQFVYSSAYPEVYSFVEKRGIKLRNSFHLKFKDCKDRKKYSQKSIESYFSKSENLPQPTAGVIRKNSCLMTILKMRKHWLRNKNKGKWKGKNKKSESKSEKLPRKIKT